MLTFGTPRFGKREFVRTKFCCSFTYRSSGAVLESSGAVLESSGAVLESSGAAIGSSGAAIGSSGAVYRSSGAFFVWHSDGNGYANACQL